MLCTTAAQSVSKNITCTSVRIRGAWAFNIGEAQFLNGGGTQSNSNARPLPSIQLSRDSGDHFFDFDSFHAPKINRAFPQETRTAFDLVANDVMAQAQRTSEPRFGRSEHRNDGHPDQRREMHGSG